MKIVRWLSDSMSAITGRALIEVEPDDVADIEQMLALVDGDNVGHFGLHVSLISTTNAPKINQRKCGGKIVHGHYTPVMQFGFPPASGMKKGTRYYEVHVNRD